MAYYSFKCTITILITTYCINMSKHKKTLEKLTEKNIKENLRCTYEGIVMNEPLFLENQPRKKLFLQHTYLFLCDNQFLCMFFMVKLIKKSSVKLSTIF